MNEQDALVFLTHIPYLGSIKIRLLVRHFGSASAAARIDPTGLLELPGFGPKIVQSWKKTLADEKWPETLRVD